MAKPPPMGHNGGFSFESREDLPPDLPKLHFAKIFLRDVLDDVLKLPNDERGFYLTALLVMYKEMEGLPADDKQAAMSMLLDVRQYRNLKAKVLARGLIYERPTGRVSNKRFEAEICSYVTEFKNRHEAAVEREQKKRLAPASRADLRDVSESSRRSPRELRDISGTSPGEIAPDFSKFPNKNNEDATTSGARENHEVDLRARVTRVRVRSIEQASKQDSLERGRERDADEDALPPKVAQAARMLAAMFGSDDEPDFDRGLSVAQTWAASFSPDDVLDAAMDFQARRADRSEPRPISERLFGEYVRQAPINRQRRFAEPPVVDKDRLDQAPQPAMSPGEICEGIAIAPDGAVRLSNGVEQEWLRKFDGNSDLLEAVLLKVPPKLRPPGRIGVSIRQQILAVLGDAHENHIQRRANTLHAVDRREASRAPRVANNSTSEPSPQAESRQERIARQMREAAAQGSKP